MRYGVIGDIHGNLEALQSVWEAMTRDGVNKVVSVGDVVGYGADPGACVDFVMEKVVACVAGNHDYAVCGKLSIDFFNTYAKQSVVWTREHLSHEQLQYLSKLSLIDSVDQEVTLVHGTMNYPEMFDYITTSYDAHLSLEVLQTPIGFFGHSHVPVTFLSGRVVSFSLEPESSLLGVKKALINVGSVGQPRDEDPRATYALYDTEQKMVWIKRVEYDIDSTVGKILKAGLPEIMGERLRYGR